METEIQNMKIEIDAEELRAMKAEEEQMKLNMRNLTYELERNREELDVTKKELGAMVAALRETRMLLHASIELQGKAEKEAAECENAMKSYLFRWLTNENQAIVKNILRFYQPADRVKMMNALLTYLMFGKKIKMEREIEVTHFKIICEKIDEDCITLNPHSLMVKLMQKYGLNEELKEVARQSTTD